MKGREALEFNCCDKKVETDGSQSKIRFRRRRVKAEKSVRIRADFSAAHLACQAAKLPFSLENAKVARESRRPLFSHP
ncbi:MAG TPA: hypothetical protein ENJ82_05470 [Bacteroidetes bacterium]|nr:hypothetical protein [Bacteroidota bacterium]